MGNFLNSCWWVGDLKLFEALAGAAFDHLNCQHIPGNLSKIFPKSQMPGSFPGGGGKWAVLELTQTAVHNYPYQLYILQ